MDSALIIFNNFKSMKTLTGLDKLFSDLPAFLKGRRVGVLCHAPSINRRIEHIVDLVAGSNDLHLGAIFGPQHGIFGETQDNMIEWEGLQHPIYKVPVYSLYGENRKPTREMLSSLDALIVDLQDVGARLYTYIWTIKLCMEACAEAGLPLVILDRPNPIGLVQTDGPVLKRDHFTFVGGAEIPLCHRMTIAEMCLWMNKFEISNCNLHYIKMENWSRETIYTESGLPWVLPSPNMPAVATALVYPGTVLFEATNISEGRGTTIPFELFGAPFIKARQLLAYLNSKNIAGCRFREHNFIPTFHKFAGEYCYGLQIHVTDLKIFKPVRTMYEILAGIIETSPGGSFSFLPPPYEYEYNLMPFDILSGDPLMRRSLEGGMDPQIEFERWEKEIAEFTGKFEQIKMYP